MVQTSPPQGFVASSVIPQELWYNVRDYGAVGDNATDNTTAFANAIAAMPTGGTLFIPTGTYLANNSSQLLSVTKRIRLIGAGPDTILRQTGTGHCLVIDSSSGNVARGIYVGNLTLATEAGGGDAFRILNVYRSVFENILVPSCASYSFHFLGGLLNSSIGLIASSNLPYTVGTRAHPTRGLSLDTNLAVASNANGFVCFTAEGVNVAPGIGIEFISGNDNTFVGGTSESNTIGIALGSTLDQTFIGVDVEANGTDITGNRSGHNFIGMIGPSNFITPAATTLQKSESAADANVLTFTPPAAAGAYRIHFLINVSAATAATLGWTATWKDSNGTAQAPTNLDLTKNGVAAPALTFLAAAGDTYEGDVAIDVDNSATAIICKLTFTGTSFAAKVSAIIEQLA